MIEKIHADIIHVTGAMLPDAVCSAQNIMPPCEVEDTVVHFYLDMSNNIQEASRSYYQDVINEFAEAFQGTVFILVYEIILLIIKKTFQAVMPLRLRIRLSIIQGTRKGIAFSRVRDFSELNDIKDHLNVIFEYSRKGIVQSHIVFNELYAADRPANEFTVIMISSRFERTNI